MTKEKYRTQLEDQVKDLISQYLQTYGEAPAVTIEWGKIAQEPKKLVDLNCMVCGKAFKGEEPKMCCSGRDCGCMGLPIEPVVCSDECYDKALNKPTHVVRKPELAPLDDWHPASEPPTNARDVIVVLSDSREFYGWYGKIRELWHIYYGKPGKFSCQICPGDTVVSWKEIE